MGRKNSPGADTDDRDSAKQAVDDTVAAIAALKNDCDAFLKGFKDASKARAFEVAQLKDVFDILSGSQVAARTGFLEGRVTTQNKQELFAVDVIGRSKLRFSVFWWLPPNMFVRLGCLSCTASACPRIART